MSRPVPLRPAAALLLALAMVAGLAACGQKGPLYLPPPAAPAPAVAPATEQPAEPNKLQDKDKEKNTAPASSSTAAPAAQP